MGVGGGWGTFKPAYAKSLCILSFIQMICGTFLCGQLEVTGWGDGRRLVGYGDRWGNEGGRRRIGFEFTSSLLSSYQSSKVVS